MLVIDIGNAYVKAIYGSRRISFPSTIGKSIDNIIYKDKEFTVGKNGDYLIEYSKSERDITEELILGTVIQFMNEIDERFMVEKLVVGLPVSQWIKNKENLLSKLKDLSPLTFEYKGKERVFHYSKVEIQPEGIGVFYGSQEVSSDSQALIIDIGGLTTDIVCIDTDGTVTKPKTINIGSLKVLNTISSEIELEYPEFGHLSTKTVTNFVRKNSIKYKGENKDISFAYKPIQKTFNELYSILTLEYAEELMYSEIYILDCLGFFANTFREKLPHLHHITDPYANAEGFLSLSE